MYVFHNTLAINSIMLRLIADVQTGRYKVIVTGVILCFFAWIISGMNFIITAY